MSTFIPTMGTNGWTNDPELVADYILSSFLTTDKSQSNILRNNNDSFQSVLAEFTNNIPGLENRLQEILETKFKAAFDNTSYIEIDITPFEDKPDQFEINFKSNIVSKGKNYTVGKLVRTDKSRIVAINNVNING